MSDDHTPSARTVQTIGRVSSVIIAALALVYGIGGSVIEYAFASDPLGPRVFPIALAVILFILSGLYWLKPGAAEGFASGPLLGKIIAIPVLVAISALLFEPAGFAISIFVLTFGTALVFGAPLLKALIGGLGNALLWWVVFAYLLEVYLPVGVLFGG